MSQISIIHKKFSWHVNNPEVLSNPEEFLGPNFEVVLNFWLSLDELSEKQIKVIDGRYLDFYNNQRSEWDKATNEAITASKETVGKEFANAAAYSAVTLYTSGVAYYVTRELIGMHKILEQQKPLTFFQMFLDSYEHNF